MASHSFQCEAGLEQQLCWPPPTNQDGRALEFASQEMKGDRELCMAAVAQDYSAIEFVSPFLRNDVEIVVAAMQSYRRENPEETGDDIVRYADLDVLGVWKHLSTDMKQNKRVRKATGL